MITAFMCLAGHTSSSADLKNVVLNCETPGQNYVFQIKEKQVDFMLPMYTKGQITSRFPASSSAFSGPNSTEYIREIITYFETKRFKILIDTENDSFSKSSLTIRSRDGHEMTCPLTCRIVNDQI